MRQTLLACFVAALVGTIGLAAEPNDPEARLRAHLESGEFAPALAIAGQAANANQRDAWLQQIAQAQADAGAKRASLATAGDIASDLLRSKAVQTAAKQPLGGGRGGAALADFDSLIELITSTVAPTSWDDVGGPGSIAPFATGVWVDAQGAMHRLLEDDLTGRIDRIRNQSARPQVASELRRTSPLRKVSLTRLERQVQLRLAAGEPLDEEIKLLAGLQGIDYVFVYPETGDLVIAGPASDWRENQEGRYVGVESGRPVLQLDDLVVVLRHMNSSDQATFGCAIVPRQEALAQTQAYLQETSKAPLKEGQRDAWLKQLRDRLGAQEIEYYGIDPRTRVAQVLVEADYRMKLVGIGLDEGVLGVPDYLSMIELKKGQSPPPLGVLRWWFALNYKSLLTSSARDAFELRGEGVQVLSENEHLTATGQRIHTGESEPLNRQFAENFTKHFSALAQKYPIYAELRNIFDIALAAAVMRAEDLPERVGWHLTCFGAPEQYPVTLGYAPKTVESVANHRVINRTQVVAAVSGGVYFDPSGLMAKEKIETDRNGTLSSHRSRSAPESRPRDAWWWD